MLKIIIIIFLSIIWVKAYDLILMQGEIEAHTEVIVDKKINPKTKDISSQLIMNEKIESLLGEISIDTFSLKSEKKDRDKDMYKLLNLKIHPKILYQIKKVTKIDNIMYKIDGILTLNGVKKDISSISLIKIDNTQVRLNGEFYIKLTDFNMQPPSLVFFLKVRDKIDIMYSLTYNKEK